MTPRIFGSDIWGLLSPMSAAALVHLKSHGVEVIKELGVSNRESVPLSQWEARRGIGLGELHPIYDGVFNQIAFVRDPDGYTVELVPQTLET